jgi:hypothetical protein
MHDAIVRLFAACARNFGSAQFSHSRCGNFCGAHNFHGVRAQILAAHSFRSAQFSHNLCGNFRGEQFLCDRHGKRARTSNYGNL